MDSPEASAEIQKAHVLDKINQTLGDLNSTSKWNSAPDFQAEYVSLQGKSIVMIDDSNMVLEAFVPDLMVATEGNADFIPFTGQDTEALVGEIESKEAEVVLLDYHLSDTVKGSQIARNLRDNGFTGTIIGFSSDPDTNQEFINAGADNCIPKEAGFPEDSIKKLAHLF